MLSDFQDRNEEELSNQTTVDEFNNDNYENDSAPPTSFGRGGFGTGRGRGRQQGMQGRGPVKDLKGADWECN
jgi:hypothetical protein